mgnify:CR=1 FL=1|tara:strand:+ start:649 stop:918 length:270 start_codon:yes stop_codon:yes gene_type:complete
MINKMFFLLILGVLNNTNSVIFKPYENKVLNTVNCKLMMQFTRAPPRDKKHKSSNIKRPRNSTRKKRNTNYTNNDFLINEFIKNDFIKN